MPQSIQSEFKPIKTSCYRKFQALKVSLQCVCNFAGSKQVAVGDSLPVSICFDKPTPVFVGECIVQVSACNFTV